jgi:hypothetical protein
VDEYVAAYLSTKAFGRRLRSELATTNLIILNDEGHSVALWRAGQQVVVRGRGL